MCLGLMTVKMVMLGVRQRYDRIMGPVFSHIMTDVPLASGWQVLCRRYHTGDLVEATVLGPSEQGDVQLFWMKRDL